MNILILSRNTALYSTQSLLVAGRRRGHFVRVVDHLYCDLVIEAGKPQIYYNNALLRNFDAIIPRIGSTATDYGAAVIRHFEAKRVFTTVGSEALLKARNKLVCLQVLAAGGIPVPKTLLTNNMAMLPYLLPHLGGYPMVVKLQNSTQGLGVILTTNKINTETTIEALNKLRQKIIIQEYIKEARGADIRIFIVDGKIVAAMKRQSKPGEFRSNLHRGATSSKVSISEKEEELALSSVKLLKLDVAGVDLLRSEHGPLVLEVNASPGLEGIETTTKVDIAAEIIQYVEREVRNRTAYKR